MNSDVGPNDSEHGNPERSLRGLRFGLLLLCLIPLLAGFRRLWLVAVHDPGFDNLRFQSFSLPIILHVISSSLYSVGGGYQLLDSYLMPLRGAQHRRRGQVLICAGLVSASSGVVMTLAYPWVNDDGIAVFLMRLFVGGLAIGATLMGIYYLTKGNFRKHAEMMTRAYALGMGAATQVLTHFPLLFAPQLKGETFRALAMAGGWVINIACAEIFLRHQTQKQERSQ